MSNTAEISIAAQTASTLCITSDENLEQLDVDVARLVFGVSQEAIDAWPWGVPCFSTDRGKAADVVGRMLAHSVREAFEVELENAATQWGWGVKPEYAGAATLLLVLTPDEICRAALKALQQSGPAALT
jgi:hypothetical protein